MPVDSTDTRALDLILERDPSGVYAVMDEATRERYRQVCRQLATWSKKDPLTVAHEAIRLSEEHAAGDERGRHVGAQLLAEGRPQLEARLGCLVPPRERAARLVRQGPNAYVVSIFVLLALALLGVERFLAARAVEPLHRVLLVAIFSLSLLEFIRERVDAVLSLLVPPLAPLPRLEPQRVFTPDTRTLVVTPLLITGAEDIESQLRMLEINYLGNAEPDLLFALLTDFRDAPEKELPGEEELLERLRQGIQELNERHGYRAQPRFFCLHRERRWNPVAGRWMGWERKRGKLDELNRLVLGAQDTSYTGAVPEVVHTIRYVITLDADTHLLPGSAARMVATLHHPLNRARFDTTGQRVIAGYSLLQPDPEFEPTRAQWLSEGAFPVSLVREKKKPQPEWPCPLYQRLFGTGDFLGKGLYDVAAFTRSLEGRLPENAILSHDKLEGMYARVAYAHDIKFFENPPKDLAVSARIFHRWLRGDWQLLPWLFPRVPSQEGRRVPNTLSLFDRWKLVQDLCRGLQPVFSVLALAYGWLWLPSSSAWAWTLGVSLWLYRNSFLFPLGQTLRTAWRARSSSASLRTVAMSVPGIITGTVMEIAGTLPITGLALDAISRVLYRLAFDRSRMLDWTTHAQASQGAARGLALLAFPEVWGAAVVSLGLAGALAVFNPGALPWASPLLLVWIPFVVLMHRKRPAPAALAVPPPELDRLRTLARSAWAQYEQWEPTGEVAPTDLALRLVAPVSAYHLDQLKLDGLVSRLGEALAVIEGLERHRGHLLERYDLRERRPVGPRHISTAESGVLAAALVIVESGLRTARSATSDVALMARLEEVEARARALREGLDFAFLYDGTIDLFHVGYDVESGSLDGAHHGLLTSGAMLAGYMAIARKEVPLRHWLALGASDQRLRAAGGVVTERNALAEHLLPTLFLWYPPATLLARAASATVEAGLGTQAPHLSMLALRFRPKDALANFQRVAEQQAFSIREQAMTLAAVANVACDDILVQHFHQHWQTGWVEALVYETEDAS
jgi:cyclic beta-1,2-glucan synthetase